MKTGLLSTTAIVLALATGPALAQSSGSGTQDMQQQNQNQGQTQNQNQGTTGQTQNQQDQGTTMGQDQDSTMGQEQGSTMGQDQGTTTGSTTPTQDDTAQTGGMSGEMFIAEQQQNDVLADELIGTTVRTTNGDSVGDVQDLLVNENNGVEAILIGVGGFLGMGEKTVAINYGQVERNRTEDGTLELVLTTDRAALENAPEFTSRDQRQAQQAQ